MEDRSKEKKKKRRSRLTTLLLVVILLAGIGLIVYPTFSDWINSMHQSRAIATYSEAVNTADADLIRQMLEDADRYNEALSRRAQTYELTESELQRYNELLDLSRTGIMGYITIPAIDVNLPIYHGTEETIPQVAVGHVEWTSLPVGGEGSHCVLSGHTGLPSAMLFTDLDRLVEGDMFMITVMDRTLTYQVDQIRIVLPYEMEELRMVPGKDYVTLLTCTPYGVNTHRLLVRGHQIDPEAEDAPVLVVPDAVRIPHALAIPAVGIPLLFLFLLGLLLYSRFKRRAHTQMELEQLLMGDRAGKTESIPADEESNTGGSGQDDLQQIRPEEMEK